MLTDTQFQPYSFIHSNHIPAQRWLLTSTLLRSLHPQLSTAIPVLANDYSTLKSPIVVLPVQGTVLHLTLADIFSHSAIESEVLIERVSSYTLREVACSAQDLVTLQQYAIFPDDALNDVLRVSLCYLLSMHLSDDGLLRLLTVLLPQHHIGDMPLGTMVRNISSQPIFWGLDFSLLTSGHLDALIMHEPLLAALASLNITTWQELTRLTEFQLLYQLGVTMRTMALIFTLWQLRAEMMVFLAEVSKGITLEAYHSFEMLVDTFICQTGATKREQDILLGRWGLLEGRKWTLDELARREDVSRVRISQIERKRVKACYSAGRLVSILHFWIAVNDALVSHGGVMLARELAQDLMRYFDWTTVPNEESLANVLTLWPQCRLIWENPIRVELPAHPCLYCASISQVFPHVLEQTPEETLTCQHACELLQRQCRQRCTLQRPTFPRFSSGYLFHLKTQLPEIMLDEDKCYSSRAWTLNTTRRCRYALISK